MIEAQQTHPHDTHLRRSAKAYRRVTLALVAAGFTTFALLYCVQPLMPVFAADYQISPTMSSLSLSISTATIAIGMLIMGPVSDAIGRKNVMAVSLFTVSLLAIASGFAPNWTSFLAIRAVEGLVLAGVPAIGMAYLAEEVHPQDLGSAMGLYIAGNSFGGLTGRVLSGVLVDLTDSSKVALAAIGVLALLSAVVFVWALPPSRHFVAERDISVAKLFAAFAAHLSDRVLLCLFIMGFLLMGSFVTVYNYAGFRLLEPPFDLGQAAAGIIFLVYLVGGPSSAWFGRLSARMGMGFMLMAGIGSMVFGLFVSLASNLIVFAIGLAFVTGGFFGAHAIASGWVSRRAIVARGQAASLYLFAYYFGSSFVGSSGGEFWTLGGWPGIVLLVAALLSVAAGIGLSLKKNEKLNSI